MTPPLPPPNGILTTAHFQVIQEASASTSSRVTSGAKRMPPLAGPRAIECCTRYPVKTSRRPSSRVTGMLTLSSREGELRTLRMPSSRLRRRAAWSKRASAASHGFNSFSMEGMCSRVGAEKSLRRLNDGWGDGKIKAALDRLDHDRKGFVEAIFLPVGSLLIALHNNSANYSVNDELPLSDAVALNNKDNPHEFILCTVRSDFETRSGLAPNAELHHTPNETDRSPSTL